MRGMKIILRKNNNKNKEGSGQTDPSCMYSCCVKILHKMEISLMHLEIKRIFTFLRLCFPDTNAREEVASSKQIKFSKLKQQPTKGLIFQRKMN